MKTDNSMIYFNLLQKKTKKNRKWKKRGENKYVDSGFSSGFAFRFHLYIMLTGLTKQIYKKKQEN